MKIRSTLFIAFLAIAIGAIATAADAPKPPKVYASTEAAKHIGETATVEGVVSTTRELPSGQAFLNFGPAFPNHDFTAVIFPADRKIFGDLNLLRGKTIWVTGKIEDYRGKPEIKLTTQDQLVIPK